MMSKRGRDDDRRRDRNPDEPPVDQFVDDLLVDIEAMEEGTTPKTTGASTDETADELLELLNALAGEGEAKKEEALADTTAGVERGVEEVADEMFEADLEMTEKDDTLFSVNHLNWEANAKLASIRENEDIELVFENLRKVPLPPSPDVRAELDSQLITKNPVSEHSEKDVGMYYHLGKSADRLPGLVRRKMDKEFEQAGGNMLMIRPVALEITKEVEKADGQLLMLDGKKGCGKSAIALYASHYAQETGQLVLSCDLGDLGLWDDKLGRIDLEPHEGLAYPSVWAMPDMSQRWFHWLCDKFTKELKSITLKHDHGIEDFYHVEPWVDEFDKETNPSKQLSIDRMTPEAERQAQPTLYDLLNYASQEREIAKGVTAGVFEEIRSIDEMKVFIVFDDFNAIIINKKEKWSVNSDFMAINTWKHIPRARLSLVDGFLSFAESPPKNGTVLAVSTRLLHKDAGLERYKQRFASKEFGIDRYTTEESKIAFKHYSLSCALEPVIDWERYPKILALTGRNPEELRRFTELSF